MKGRAVVTGLGAVSGAGIDTVALAAALREGRSCVRALPDVGTEWPGAIGAPVPGLDPLDYVSRRDASRLERSALLWVIAGLAALEQSRLPDGAVARSRIGVFEGPSTATFPAGATALAARWRLHGLSCAVSNGSVSSASALALAVGQIRLGELDACVVGGGEAPLAGHVFAAFGQAGLLSVRTDAPATACRPFDATRDGTVLGEAGAALVVESMDHALRRGARIYAEVAAVSVTGEDEGDVTPSADVRQRARGVEAALRQGRTLPNEVEYVSAHGSATRANDTAETRALKAALGEHAYGVPVSAMKSMLGHTLGAAAALETVGAILAMNGGFLPPTINLSLPDPECDLDYVPGHARRESVNVALVCNANPGGRSTAILLRR